MVSRLRFVFASVAVALPLATSARADNAPPAPPVAAPAPAAPPGYAPPGYVPPGYAPPGYAPPGWGAPRPLAYGPPAPAGYYPAAETLSSTLPMRRRSPTMIAVGATLISIGTTALIAGSAFVSGSSQGGVFCDQNGCSTPTDTAAKNTGIGLTVLGVVAMGVGVPVLVVGAVKVPDRGDASQGLTLRLGAGSARVGFDF